MSLVLCSIQDFFSKLFPSFSQDESHINLLFLKYLIFAGFIVSLIAGVIIISAIRFRAKRRPDEPKQVAGHKMLEIAWTVFPFIVVTYFFILTVKVMREINTPIQKGQKPDIIIIAHQWWWDMRYPNNNIITANELHIPVGKRLLMRIESADVIHDWWVQALGPKIDAIPGQPNYSWIETNKADIYEGTCSEYCGSQHAWMRIRVIAQSQAGFDQWVRHQQKLPELPLDSLGQKGAMLFQQKTCAMCHAIRGTPADAHIGPDLSHLSSRQTILSGMLPNTNQNLTRYLINPQKVKEGARMPNFMLSNDELKELIKYLEGLK